MNKPNINIQDGFLFQSLKDGRAMTVELVTGKRIDGRIRRFDRFAVVIEAQGREVLATNAPVRPLKPNTLWLRRNQLRIAASILAGVSGGSE